MANSKNKSTKSAPKPAATVNPMKDGPDEETVTFESEELAKYAGEAADEYGLDLGEMVGTGPEGVITADDVDKAIEAANDLDDPDAINFASEEAGEFYAENEDDIDLDEVEGSGKDGAITVEDLENALPAAPEGEIKFTTDAVKEAAELAVKDHGVDLKTITGTAKDGSINAADVRKAVEAIEADKAPKTPEETDPADGEGGEEVESIESIITDLVGFGLPVRGALKNKPLVLERWNDLQARALKVKRAF